MSTQTAFEWNEKTTATAIELYTAAVEELGAETANSKESLDGIAKQLGAKSGASVRSKLSAEKVYQKAVAKRKFRGTTKVPKINYIRGLQTFAEDQEFDLNVRKLESLESATVADILDIIRLVEKVSGKAIQIAGVEAAEEAPTPPQITARA